MLLWHADNSFIFKAFQKAWFIDSKLNLFYCTHRNIIAKLNKEQ